MSHPLVSVITPAYNAEPYIAETIQSVLDQSYAHWEMLIVDDGSTDNTVGVVTQFDDSRIKLIQIEHSGLPAVGRNQALQAASGSYVAFLDADDVWRSDKLAKQIQYLESNPDVALCFTNAWIVFKNNEIVILYEKLPDQGVMFRLLYQKNFIIHSSVVVRESVLDRHGGFDVDPRLRGTEDYELWLRLSMFYKFGGIEEPLLWYRVRSGSVSGDKLTMSRGLVVVLEKVYAKDPKLVAELGNDWQKHLVHVMLNYAGVLFQEGCLRAGLRWVGTVCLRYPHLCVRDVSIMTRIIQLLFGPRGYELVRSVKRRLCRVLPMPS